MCPEILLITGEFNFHLDDIADEDSRKCIEVLETFGLIQHVKFPTHVSNHILDLIITRSSSDVIIGEIQASFFLSDHCFVAVPFFKEFSLVGGGGGGKTGKKAERKI